ncbi:hypothetical protein A2U01_0036635, partial [Trifolium medium]|nr:hypothetical protein [Trifolium medium]
MEEFYVNAYGRLDDDYTSYVRGVEINYAPDVIDTIFGFKPEEHCWVRQRHDTAHTDEEYTEMLQTLALCWNEMEIIISRCHAVYAIMREEPIRVGEMIVRSIKRMITAAESYIGHPFVITTLCDKLQVPTEDDDEIAVPVDPLGR